MIAAAFFLASSFTATPTTDLIATCAAASDLSGDEWADALRSQAKANGWSPSDEAVLLKTCGVYAGGKIAGLRTALKGNTTAGQVAMENIDLRQRLENCRR